MTSWEKIDTSLTVDDAWLEFKSQLNDIVNKHVPLATKRVRATCLPWLTNEIRITMNRSSP